VQIQSGARGLIVGKGGGGVVERGKEGRGYTKTLEMSKRRDKEGCWGGGWRVSFLGFQGLFFWRLKKGFLSVGLKMGLVSYAIERGA